MPEMKFTDEKLARQQEKRIHELEQRVKELEKLLGAEREKLTNAIYLNRKNCGGHYYPGVAPSGEMFTSDCVYCKCWMGFSRSGGPEGIDPFGDCPGNPKLRDAYKLLKEHTANQTGLKN